MSDEENLLVIGAEINRKLLSKSLLLGTAYDDDISIGEFKQISIYKNIIKYFDEYKKYTTEQQSTLDIFDV